MNKLRNKLFIILFLLFSIKSFTIEVKTEIAGKYVENSSESYFENRVKSELSIKNPDFYAAVRADGIYKDDKGEVKIERAYIDLYKNSFTFSLGKQRIFWGSGYLFNYVDLFNEVDIEDPKGDKKGVNGAIVKYKLNDTSRAEAALIFKDEKKSFASRLSTTVGLFELTCNYIKNRKLISEAANLYSETDFIILEAKGEAVVGLWGTAVFKENSEPVKSSSRIYTAGTDYTFSINENPLYLLEELSYDEKAKTLLSYSLATYDFTNDLKLSASLISDTESGSSVAGSSLKYLYNDYITATVYFNNYKDCNNSDSPILSENSDGNEYKLELKADF